MKWVVIWAKEDECFREGVSIWGQFVEFTDILVHYILQNSSLILKNLKKEKDN